MRLVAGRIAPTFRTLSNIVLRWAGVIESVPTWWYALILGAIHLPASLLAQQDPARSIPSHLAHRKGLGDGLLLRLLRLGLLADALLAAAHGDILSRKLDVYQRFPFLTGTPPRPKRWTVPKGIPLGAGAGAGAGAAGAGLGAATGAAAFGAAAGATGFGAAGFGATTAGAGFGAGTAATGFGATGLAGATGAAALGGAGLGAAAGFAAAAADFGFGAVGFGIFNPF